MHQVEMLKFKKVDKMKDVLNSYETKKMEYEKSCEDLSDHIIRVYSKLIEESEDIQEIRAIKIQLLNDWPDVDGRNKMIDKATLRGDKILKCEFGDILQDRLFNYYFKEGTKVKIDPLLFESTGLYDINEETIKFKDLEFEVVKCDCDIHSFAQGSAYIIQLSEMNEDVYDFLIGRKQNAFYPPFDNRIQPGYFVEI